MASIHITIETDGAAMCDDGRPTDTAIEIARLLRVLADQLLEGDGYSNPRDLNGYTCGKVEVNP